jgi:glycosyltransferase involved in cell wall biosynthesis
MEHEFEPVLSVVVIGLNEEARLRSSLESVIACMPQGCDFEVFYIDSGSTDRSVEIASSIPGVEVLHLGSSQPSAARARNVGLRRARGQYVQLVDGDSVIQPGWIGTAVAALEGTPGIACVFGQCVEMFPEQSIYMRVCSLDWQIPPGDHRLCGGNAMWKMPVIAAHGFFDETLRLGEEPDLCYRVRQQGGRIVCIDAPMVKHDLGILRFGQYWKRAENSGKGYARVASRYWRNAEKLWLRELLRNFAEPLLWPVFFLTGWSLGGLPGALALLAGWWCARAVRIARYVRTRTANFADALLYGLHCQLVCVPLALGQVKAFLGSK